jgi:tRNA (cytidine/uridine-2'-O-)-methyltransferase
MMRLALYQPDIPQNAGTLLRLGACLGIGVDVIEPCGFLFTDSGFRRAGMDYLAAAAYRRHDSWTAFLAAQKTLGGRLVLLSSKAERPYTEFAFAGDDVILLGRESAGVPNDVRATADAALRIPLKPGLRSLNVALAAAMVLGEALRQTKGFPLE